MAAVGDPPVFASEAWARSHGCRGIASCSATPLAAFEAGAAAERDRIRHLAVTHGAVCDVSDIWHGSDRIGGKTRAFADLLEPPGE